MISQQLSSFLRILPRFGGSLVCVQSMGARKKNSFPMRLSALTIELAGNWLVAMSTGANLFALRIEPCRMLMRRSSAGGRQAKRSALGPNGLRTDIVVAVANVAIVNAVLSNIAVILSTHLLQKLRKVIRRFGCRVKKVKVLRKHLQSALAIREFIFAQQNTVFDVELDSLNDCGSIAVEFSDFLDGSVRMIEFADIEEGAACQFCQDSLTCDFEVTKTLCFAPFNLFFDRNILQQTSAALSVLIASRK
jgi:hypothetical protein